MAESRVRALAPERAPGSTSELPADPAVEPGAGSAPTSAPAAPGLSAAAPRGRRRTDPRRAAVAAAPFVTIAIFLMLAAAPMAAATAALWAMGSALIALARIALAAQAGQALNNPDLPVYLGALETAARIGFLAIGYLALIFALMTLMAGLFGRGWGRLFILPGALFSATALALLCLGVVLVAPLASYLPIPPAWLIPPALYALMDAVLVSGTLVDARLTRTPTASGRRRAIRLAPTSRARQRRS